MLVYLMNVFMIVLFIIGLYTFISLRKFLLSMLLSLEFIMLNMFMYLYMTLIYNELELYVLMFFLIFVVCEGALGLSILVSMIRTHGNNYFQSFNVLMC